VILHAPLCDAGIARPKATPQFFKTSQMMILLAFYLRIIELAEIPDAQSGNYEKVLAVASLTRNLKPNS
jgi:hypothetical protein